MAESEPLKDGAAENDTSPGASGKHVADGGGRTEGEARKWDESAPPKVAQATGVEGDESAATLASRDGSTAAESRPASARTGVSAVSSRPSFGRDQGVPLTQEEYDAMLQEIIQPEMVARDVAFELDDEVHPGDHGEEGGETHGLQEVASTLQPPSVVVAPSQKPPESTASEQGRTVASERPASQASASTAGRSSRLRAHTRPPSSQRGTPYSVQVDIPSGRAPTPGSMSLSIRGMSAVVSPRPSSAASHRSSGSASRPQSSLSAAAQESQHGRRVPATDLPIRDVPVQSLPAPEVPSVSGTSPGTPAHQRQRPHSASTATRTQAAQQPGQEPRVPERSLSAVSGDLTISLVPLGQSLEQSHQQRTLERKASPSGPLHDPSKEMTLLYNPQYNSDGTSNEEGWRKDWVPALVGATRPDGNAVVQLKSIGEEQAVVDGRGPMDVAGAAAPGIAADVEETGPAQKVDRWSRARFLAQSMSWYKGMDTIRSPRMNPLPPREKFLSSDPYIIVKETVHPSQIDKRHVQALQASVSVCAITPHPGSQGGAVIERAIEGCRASGPGRWRHKSDDYIDYVPDEAVAVPGQVPGSRQKAMRLASRYPRRSGGLQRVKRGRKHEATCPWEGDMEESPDSAELMERISALEVAPMKAKEASESGGEAPRSKTPLSHFKDVIGEIGSEDTGGAGIQGWRDKEPDAVDGIGADCNEAEDADADHEVELVLAKTASIESAPAPQSTAPVPTLVPRVVRVRSFHADEDDTGKSQKAPARDASGAQTERGRERPGPPVVESVPLGGAANKGENSLCVNTEGYRPVSSLVRFTRAKTDLGRTTSASAVTTAAPHSVGGLRLSLAHSHKLNEDMATHAGRQDLESVAFVSSGLSIRPPTGGISKGKYAVYGVGSGRRLMKRRPERASGSDDEDYEGGSLARTPRNGDGGGSRANRALLRASVASMNATIGRRAPLAKPRPVYRADHMMRV